MTPEQKIRLKEALKKYIKRCMTEEAPNIQALHKIKGAYGLAVVFDNRKVKPVEVREKLESSKGALDRFVHKKADIGDDKSYEKVIGFFDNEVDAVNASKEMKKLPYVISVRVATSNRIKETSVAGQGASFASGNGEQYATPNAFGKSKGVDQSEREGWKAVPANTRFKAKTFDVEKWH